MKSTKNTIVLTGGGTAGHVMVNINLEKELKKHFDQIIYIGSENGIEKELVKKQTSYKYIAIPTVRFDRSNLLKNFSVPFKLKSSIRAAKNLLKHYNPSVVFSKGGYVGLPVVIAAKKIGIPALCHESDITMGLANKIAKHYVVKILTNFKLTADKNGKKCVHTSMPLKLSKISKEQARIKLGITGSLPVLLITGGSLGAKAINEFIFENVDKLTKKYFVIHLVGKNNLNKKLTTKPGYKQIEFSNDMWTIFKAADYAISRAGANTIIELLANEILTIFIPLPKSVSRGDQIENAKYLEHKGVSKTILQQNLTIDNLFSALSDLKSNSKQIKTAIKAQNITDGTNVIVNEILTSKNPSV